MNGSETLIIISDEANIAASEFISDPFQSLNPWAEK
jgi:hypothetical protein